MDHNKVNIIRSQRNGKILLYRGNTYNLHWEDSGSSNWRCRDRKCKERLILKNEVVTLKNAHQHEMNLEKNEAVFLRFKALNRSLNTCERPRDIILGELGNVPAPVLNHLPNFKSLNDTIIRYRKKEKFVVSPNDIPNDIKKTYANEKFLIYDSGQESINRILIFSTSQNLSYL
ncbi:hypothetical protein DMUE_3656 [Dictyocoela muelleri]|nr:hypothetical protein DMUE_3656 [Dictyocoela muelleri]